MEVKRSQIRYFRSAAEMRKWLAANHDKADELWVGFYRKDSGRKGVSYSDSIDEALCFGWIDGIRKSVDELSYTNRFTPRRARSVWSNVNIARVKSLIERGRMTPRGLTEYEKRTSGRSGVYSFERDSASLSPAQEKEFRKNRRAWRFFEAQPPSYRKVVTWWVVSARKEETRARRLEQLISASSQERRFGTPASGKA